MLNGLAPLPVTLAAFDVTPFGKTAHLTWAVAAQRDNAFFAVEMSRDGDAFTEVGRVDGDGTSSAWREFAYAYSAREAGRHYFRLRQVDFDGAYEYSPVVTAELAGGGRLGVRHDLQREAFLVDAPEDGVLRIVDMTGAVRETVVVVPGLQPLDVSGLPAGIYAITDGRQAVRFVR